MLRGDIARLGRCAAIVTGADGSLPRCKPFKYTYEKEIVLYAYFKQLDYFSTECIYSPNAYRGHAREYLKDLEKIRPRAILDIIHTGENLHISDESANANNNNNKSKPSTPGTCVRCGYISSNKLCKACVLLEGLNKGKPKLAIGRSSKVRASHEMIDRSNHNHTQSILDGAAEDESSNENKVDRKTLLTNIDF